MYRTVVLPDCPGPDSKSKEMYIQCTIYIIIYLHGYFSTIKHESLELYKYYTLSDMCTIFIYTIFTYIYYLPCPFFLYRDISDSI